MPAVAGLREESALMQDLHSSHTEVDCNDDNDTDCWPVSCSCGVKESVYVMQV